LNASRQTGAALGVAVLGALVSGTSTALALVIAAVVLLAGASIAAAALDEFPA
jgi:DHA2 family methylenomycin A resistance protein-like MFS transporter